MTSATVRRIMTLQDMDSWKRSPAYADYLSFIHFMNECAKTPCNLMSIETVSHPRLKLVLQMLEDLSSAVDDVEPLDNDSNQRFGNKAYRTWFDRMKEVVGKWLVEEERGNELICYVVDSFGNYQRIDYGTGHEMNFVIYLMGVFKVEMGFDEVRGNEAKAVGRQLVTIFAAAYLPLVRKIQTRYTLEPAGSHGVFSLDDFQFLPFLFGSAQLVAHPDIEPSKFPEPEVSEKLKTRFIFHAAINYINQVKKGPFAEHSNQLWNISAVDSWAKINKGLLKMYTDEVLNKFPIVQHLLFEPGSSFMAKTVLQTHASSSGDEIIKTEFNVIYSTSYEIPTLYFRVTKQDGSFLELESVWRRIPRVFKNSEMFSFGEFGQMVTATEHPIFGSPTLFLHPCNTSHLMSQVAGEQDNLLLTWLSSIAPVVGLDVMNDYSQRLSRRN